MIGSMKTEHQGNKRKRWGRIVVGSVIGIAGIALILAVLLVIKIIADAPDVSQIKITHVGEKPSVVYDNKGQEIAKFSNEDSLGYVKIEEIPKHLQAAVVVSEDKRFYEHNGMDFSKIGTAFWHNLMTGSVTQGGTTITGQLIKSQVALTGKNVIERKIQEQYLAVEFEKLYDKDTILEFYLNNLAFQGNIQGIQMAAHNYFDEDASNLNLVESAVLAAMIDAPTYYSPVSHPDNNWKKAQDILEAMEKQGYISKEEKQQALNTPVYEKIRKVQAEEHEKEVHTYFVDDVYRQVINDLQEQKGISEYEAKEMVYNGGLQIYSTVDNRLQNIVDCYMSDNRHYPEQESMQKDSQLQAAFVLTDYRTGEVKAIYGGRGEKETLSFDYATQALRQPASIFKILAAYAPGIDQGLMTPETAFNGEPVKIRVKGGGVWSVKDAPKKTTDEPITIKEALAQDSNTIAVRAFLKSGKDIAFDYLNSFGFTSLKKEDKTEALSLGGLTEGVSILELNSAYGTIANEGQYIKPTFYTKVLDQEGQVILDTTSEKQRRNRTHQVIKKETADMLTEMLVYAAEKSSSTSAVKDYLDKMPVAGKSGISSEIKDLLYTGYTPYYAATIWLGYENPKSMEVYDSYQTKLWGEIMKEIHKESSYKAFK